MLENCPYCGRPAEVFIGSEMSDTSRIHKIRCSYMNCLTIERAYSGYSLDYVTKVNEMKEDWNVAVKAILRERQKLGKMYNDLL